MSLLVAAALALAAPSQASPPSPSVPSAEGCQLEQVVLGPADAPLKIELYLDPLANTSLSTWLATRQLVGEMGGQATAQVVIVRSPDQRDPRMRDPDQDRIRTWAMGARDAPQLESILREIDRSSWRRLSARLNRSPERAALEKRLGLPTSPPAKTECARVELGERSQALVSLHLAQHRNTTARAPIFGISTDLASERLITNDPWLRELRPALEIALQRLQAEQPGWEKTPATALPRPQREPYVEIADGMWLGGPAHPHHLVLYANSEQDATLTGLLPHALRLRRTYPGAMSVQIVARGHRAGAIQLRGRLCAAIELGLEMEYAHALAGTEPAAPDLEQHLDVVSEAKNCPATDQETNNRGAWLDGAATNRQDLDQLRVRLAQDLQRSPLGWFWRRQDFR